MSQAADAMEENGAQQETCCDHQAIAVPPVLRDTIEDEQALDAGALEGESSVECEQASNETNAQVASLEVGSKATQRDGAVLRLPPQQFLQQADAGGWTVDSVVADGLAYSQVA